MYVSTKQDLMRCTGKAEGPWSSLGRLRGEPLSWGVGSGGRKPRLVFSADSGSAGADISGIVRSLQGLRTSGPADQRLRLQRMRPMEET